MSANGRVHEPRAGAGATALHLLSRFGLPLFLLILLLFFSLERPDSFPTTDNLRGIVDDQSVIIVAALGVMLTLIVGEFDLSIAANLTLANVLVIGLSERQDLPVALGIVLAIGASMAVGLLNGLIVTRLRVHAFVATLGMATFLAGMVQLYTGGTDLIEAPDGLMSLARDEVAGIPLSMLYALVVAAVLALVMRYLTVGRRMLAVGGNERAAALTGIRTQRYRVGAFVAGGLLAGIAGAILGARLGSATAAGNADLLLPIFAAALLGSTTITPGRFNVLGVVIAVFFLAITVSGLQQMGVAAWVQPAFNGAALIAAVAISGWAARARIARARRQQLEAIASTRTSPEPTGSLSA